MYRAIIIDDEKWVVKSLIATIANQDLFEITAEFYNGNLGLEYLKKEQPELAFVDVQIGDINGLEILSAARQLGLNTLFIIISGHAEFAYAQKAMFYNAIGYCLKPFSRNELMDSMQKAYDILNNRAQQPTAPVMATEQGYQISRETVQNTTVQAMLDYTYNNFCSDISLPDLASQTALNTNYASQIFKQETGKTYSTFLTELRMDYAKWLLANTDMPISIIATQTGYKDYFYFAKVFKKTFDDTPTTYRESAKKSSTTDL